MFLTDLINSQHITGPFFLPDKTQVHWRGAARMPCMCVQEGGGGDLCCVPKADLCLCGSISL